MLSRGGSSSEASLAAVGRALGWLRGRAANTVTDIALTLGGCAALAWVDPYLGLTAAVFSGVAVAARAHARSEPTPKLYIASSRVLSSWSRHCSSLCALSFEALSFDLLARCSSLGSLLSCSSAGGAVVVTLISGHVRRIDEPPRGRPRAMKESIVATGWIAAYGGIRWMEDDGGW